MNPYTWDSSTPKSVSRLYGELPDWKGIELSPSICLAAIYAQGDPFHFLTKDILFYFSRPYLIAEEADVAWAENEIFRRGIKYNNRYTHSWWRGKLNQACRFSWQTSYYRYKFKNKNNDEE